MDAKTKEKTVPWYVVQVSPFKEQLVCELIEKIAPAGVIDEVFSPAFETETKDKGVYKMRRHTFLPGYVIVATDNLPALLELLSDISEFTQVLKSCDTYAPLEEEEKAWLEGLTQRGNRVVAMSTGVIEGGKAIILSGPLRGKEAMIKKIDRHHSTAYIEFTMCNRTVVSKVGLVILHKR